MEKLTNNVKIIFLQTPMGRQAVVEVLSEIYCVVLMRNSGVLQWFAQKAS